MSKNKRQLQPYFHLRKKNVWFTEYFDFVVLGVKLRILFPPTKHYHEMHSQPVLTSPANRNCINNLYLLYSNIQWEILLFSYKLKIL